MKAQYDTENKRDRVKNAQETTEDLWMLMKIIR